MGRRVYPRTVVEKAPSHDGMPCFAAWEMTEMDPDTQTPPDASNRPKWSIQLYDTTPAASDHEHVRATAIKVEESTRQARDRRGASNRVEVHGLPLPAGTPEAERVALCAAHHRAEVAARNASGAPDFFIPPTFDDVWEHRIVVIENPDAGEASPSETDDKDGTFLAVFFSMKPQAAADSPGGPDYEVVRFSGKDLGDRLQDFTSSIAWFYDSYVGDGTIYHDLEKWRREA
ncbi:hypothetical protein CGRA01v4_08549 [Colletotrichum graminicola]|uniref:Uncharacterized protein n=1 Tax=Colletotrichum graminicola (strain M1.001 / M2 / FGSC 10212) TaxID=645133 RepID=E3QJH3_COLGM|nr:uncharacterized protein GLRG_06155 [Colletotrichum graminicola M1.001]EFQ31011.1 hypothetical protein GLRG_06155 [Colletotrichum graminicola M1.001]WDK17266.1 hypothetical protein CGRA01v4_08549 [Colletotrichum graminicola]